MPASRTPFLALGALFGFLSVAAGAFGAHGLRDRLPAEQLAVFQTAVRYQMWHALALLAVELLRFRRRSPGLAAAGWLFVGGIVVFSGSLFSLSLLGWKWMGAVAPIGGTAFLAGWLCLVGSALRADSSPPIRNHNV